MALLRMVRFCYKRYTRSPERPEAREEEEITMQIRARSRCAPAVLRGILAFAVVLGLTARAGAQIVRIEPDDYADGTNVSNINPAVRLSTTLADNVPVPLYFVSANEVGAELAPTGTRVFGHANVPFFNDFRRLRMDFADPVFGVSILFGGGTFGATDGGRLEIYNAGGTLLDWYDTALLAVGQSEAMSLYRPQGDIGFAIAYTPAGRGNFGRLDGLQFSVVPEPGTLALLLALVGLIARRRRSSQR
jgi:hypothetical protein